MIEYEKDLNELKEQILKEGDTLLSKRDLLERFCEVDEAYNGSPWNLLQILTNIHIFIGEEPCEDAVSKQDCINAIENTDCELSPQAWEEITNNIMSLPPATPKDEVKKLSVEKKGKWINKSHTSDCGIKFVASECTCCGKKTFFDCDQLVYNYCPNCGAEMESEE